MNSLQTRSQSQSSISPWEDPEMLKARMERMVQLMQKVMKPDVHYGKVPGCKQNTLFQPGSQLLSLTFKIGHKPGTVEDLSTDDEIRYRVTDEVFDQATGSVIGYGIGECSSNEEKYAWRRASTDEEFEATAIDRRRIKYGRGEGGRTYETKQVRTNPADVANTVLKMARKRANVNGTIEALAASEIFTQDLEDLPDGMELGDRSPSHSSRPTNMQPPTRKSDQASAPADDSAEKPDDEIRKANKWISTKQEGRLHGICKTAGVDPHSVRNWLREIHKDAAFQLYKITWAKRQGKDQSEYDGVCELIEKNPSSFLPYTDEAIAAKQASQETAANGPKIEAAPEATNGTGKSAGDTQPPAQAGAQAESEGPSPQDEFLASSSAVLDELGFTTQAERDKYVADLLKPLKVATLDKVPPEHFKAIMAELSRRYKEAKAKK